MRRKLGKKVKIKHDMQEIIWHKNIFLRIRLDHHEEDSKSTSNEKRIWCSNKYGNNGILKNAGKLED